MSEELLVVDESTVPTGGNFVASLKRSNAKIREDRAEAITKSADLYYKRLVEDKIVVLDSVIADRNNALDLSPTTTDSLTPAKNFDANAFAKRDLELSIKIRNLAIEVEVAKKRYTQLFGKEIL